MLDIDISTKTVSEFLTSLTSFRFGIRSAHTSIQPAVTTVPKKPYAKSILTNPDVQRLTDNNPTPRKRKRDISIFLSYILHMLTICLGEAHPSFFSGVKPSVTNSGGQALSK